MEAPVKLIRLFKLYSVALQSFIAAQQAGAMDDIYLALGDKAKFVNMKIPLAFIIGDNQGGDMIAGRTCHYGITASRISRCCDATPDNYADVTADSCSFLEMERIMDLVRTQSWGELDSLYQAPFWNPFFDVDYGASSLGIFFAACPPEGLHALEQGIFKHLLHELLGVYLKPAQIVMLDKVIQSWVGGYRQRLFRSSNSAESPRLLFKDGISSLSNTPGCDRAGMVFALTIVTLTRDGKAAFEGLEEDVTQDITYALEMLMCYWAWLKQDKYWRLDSIESLDSVKTAVSTMLDELVTCIPRLKGNGWNIPKIHEQLHVPFYILMFGAHRNLHTGPTEHNHIELSKQPARRTQMRAKEFDWQVAQRLLDQLVVKQAEFTMCHDRPVQRSEHHDPNSVPHNSAMFDMLFWKDDQEKVHADLATPKIHGKYMPCMRILQVLADFCMPTLGANQEGVITRIRCVTELRINNIHVRANPVEKDGAWYDNIVLQDDPDLHGIASTTVGNLKFMFFFPDKPSQRFGILHRAYGYHPQHSVFTHMYRMEFDDDPADILSSPNHYNRSEDCWVLDDHRKTVNLRPSLLVVSLDPLISHMLMIPYHAHSQFMIGILNQGEWADKFVTY